jgi:hypothetical protein
VGLKCAEANETSSRLGQAECRANKSCNCQKDVGTGLRGSRPAGVVVFLDEGCLVVVSDASRMASPLSVHLFKKNKDLANPIVDRSCVIIDIAISIL